MQSLAPALRSIPYFGMIDRYFLESHCVHMLMKGSKDQGRHQDEKETETVVPLQEKHFCGFVDLFAKNKTMNFNNRKIRKPLMERKRRARINQSLNELQQLLTATDFTSKGTKLEKADILEMTVQYVRQIQKNECTQEIKENLENLMLERYLLGFEKCAEEIAKMPGLDFSLRLTIKTHLQNYLEKQKSRLEGTGEGDGCIPRKACSLLIQEPLRILPSKLPNGDVILLLSSNVKCGSGLGNTHVWRPWW